jgi:FkbM family methyltransferase
MTKLGGIFYPTEHDGKVIPFDSLFLPYIWKEIYFDGVYIDILNGRKDMVIVDVGSQIGLTVKHFQPYSKKVYAIEPSPESFFALQKNKEFNHWDNVELFNYALSDKDGKAMLNFLPTNRTCNSITNDYKQGGSEVITKSFDTFFKDNKIKHVDFMKFDVEGAEDMILRSEGFKKVVSKIDAIEIEFHYPTWPQLADYLISLGYKARRYPCSAIVILFSK